MSSTGQSQPSIVLRLPVIGRLIHIISAIYRLPELRGFVYDESLRTSALPATASSVASSESDTADALAAVVTLEQSVTALNDNAATQTGLLQHHAKRAEVIEGYIRDLSDLGYGLSRRLDDQTLRVRAGEDQFSTVLDSLSTLNSRIDQETAPLKQSLPVALREMRRTQMLLGNAVRDLRLQSERHDERQVALEGAQVAAQRVADELPALGQQVDRLNIALAEEQTRLDQALGSLAAGNSSITDRLDLLDGHVEANQELRRSVEFLFKRVEFVRQELMYELRYGSGVASNAPAGIEPRMIDPAKVDAARTTPQGIRLNLGCGHLPLDGYVNVDNRDVPGVDIVADVGRLPFENDDVAEIMSAHVLEHFPQEKLRRVLLPYWKGLLRRGGKFRAIVPDIDAMISHYTQGEVSYEAMREVIYGAQDYDGDFHFNMFSPASLSALLTEAGFVAVTVSDSARRNGMCFEFEIHASVAS